MRAKNFQNTGLFIAYLWAAFWTIGPVAASWPHLMLGFLVCVPGASALAVVYAVREQPVPLGVLLLAVGVAVAVLAETRYLIIVLGAAPAVVSGALMIVSRFVKPSD